MPQTLGASVVSSCRGSVERTARATSGVHSICTKTFLGGSSSSSNRGRREGAGGRAGEGVVVVVLLVIVEVVQVVVAAAVAEAAHWATEVFLTRKDPSWDP